MTSLAQGFANVLSRTWWALLLRGVVAIVFGVFSALVSLLVFPRLETIAMGAKWLGAVWVAAAAR